MQYTIKFNRASNRWEFREGSHTFATGEPGAPLVAEGNGQVLVERLPRYTVGSAIALALLMSRKGWPVAPY